MIKFTYEKEVEAYLWSDSSDRSAIERLAGDKLKGEQREGVGAVGYFLETKDGTKLLSDKSLILVHSNGEFEIQEKDRINPKYKRTVPPHIDKAYRYVSDCNKDYGFMGSPQYYEYKEEIRRWEDELK